MRIFLPLACIVAVAGTFALGPAAALAAGVHIPEGNERSVPARPYVVSDSTPSADTLLEVTGTVRNDNTDAPIPNVHIRVVGTTMMATTGGDGQYRLALRAGSYPLQFSRTGFEPITVVATVGTGNTVLDVNLIPLPSVLAPVHVDRARLDAIQSDTFPNAGLGRVINKDGGLVWSHDAIRSAPQLDQADLFRLIGSVPIASMQSESPSSLHVGGGSADQTLVLLDGIPVENAVHAGWLPSAIDPSAIGTMTLYADHIPAQFGGRLSGVVDLRTRGLDTTQSDSDVVDVSGTIGYAGLSVLAIATNRAQHASGLLSLRHGPHALNRTWLTSTDTTNLFGTNGWFDGMARGEFPLGGGTLTALGFRSHDVLHFANPTPPFTLNSGFEWITSALGVTWTRPFGASEHTIVTIREWMSNTSVNAAWAANTQRLTTLQNRLQQSGTEAEVHTTHGKLETVSGISYKPIQTTYMTLPYNLTPQRFVSSSPNDRVVFFGKRALVSTYTNVRWQLSPRWTIMPGMRITNLSEKPFTQRWQHEPRLGTTFKPWSRMQLSAYFGHTTQPLQSLRNEETGFDGIAGLNLFVVSDYAMPVANATTGSMNLTTRLTRTMSATLGTYARQLRHIVVAPPIGNAPFASDTLVEGNGRISGLYATLARTTPRLAVEASMRTTHERFSAPGLSYQPGFAPARFASLTAAWRLDRKTEMHGLLTAIGGRRAPLTQTPFSFDPKDNLGGSKDPYGSAQTADPGSRALPMYVNMNLGISRIIPLHSDDPGNAALRVFGAIDNIFNHANTIGIQEGGGGTTESASGAPIRYRPRAALIGLDWHL